MYSINSSIHSLFNINTKMNGHSKGKGPLKLYENDEPKQKKWQQEKIGLMEGGYVLARPEHESEWHLAKITATEPLKSTSTFMLTAYSS